MGGSSRESASEPPGIVYAVNATTGKRVWSATPFGLGPLSDSVTAGRYVVTAGADADGSEVSVLHLSNGKPAWHRFGCGYFTSQPALVVGLRVLSYGCGHQGLPTLLASNLATGALDWTLAGARKVLAVDAARVYATCGKDQHVCAYNIGTGALEWENGRFYSRAIGAEADGVLYVGYNEYVNVGVTVALDAATGKIIKKLPFMGAHISALAVGNGRIVVDSNPRVLDLFGLPGS